METMILLDGRKAREHYTQELVGKIKTLAFVPCLVIIQIGNRPDSDSFIKAKKSFAQKIGVQEIHVQLAGDVSEKETISVIKKYNDDATVQGIIVQLPLPAHLNPKTIIASINPLKDVDGLINPLITPATARGVRELCAFYNVSFSGKKVTVVGQSDLVGKPIAAMCMKEKAHVTVCDSKTENLQQKTKDADIVIVAIGKPKFIGPEYISSGQIVIDVGITRAQDVAGSVATLSGDVDFDAVKDTVSAITPVPGGVGQMTVLALFENLVDACYTTNY